MQFSNFLRTVLKLDAAACLAMAVTVLPAAGLLAEPLGIDTAALRGAAAALIPIGLVILWLSTRRDAPAALIWLVIIGNVGWTMGSLAATAALPTITTLGQAAVAGQGLMVLAVAAAEWVGLRASAQTDWVNA
jgi:hypothetical protein